MRLAWPMEKGWGRVTLDLVQGRPLVASLGTADGPTGADTPILQSHDPLFFLTVGERQGNKGVPPTHGLWQIFFDNPAKRPFETHLSALTLTRAAVTSAQGRATLRT